MAETPTLGELFKTKVILEAEVARAVQAAVSGDRNEAYDIGNGYTLDLNAALKAHEIANTALSSPVASLAHKWNMARTAILLARPVRA